MNGADSSNCKEYKTEIKDEGFDAEMESKPVTDSNKDGDKPSQVKEEGEAEIKKEEDLPDIQVFI